jgi:hypothetical protein
VYTETMTSAPALVGRLFWMMIGPFALAICALSIVGRRDGWLSALDLMYFVVFGGMLLGRWIEFRYSRPMTAAGEPATADHLRRYTLVLSILAIGAWVAANLVGNQAIRFLG